MIPLYKPYMPESLSDLNRVLYSGNLAAGEYVKAFENQIARRLNTTHVACVNSYNSAVLTTLITLGIKPGDEVVLSPMACLAAIQPYIVYGCKLVWADINPLTGSLDPDSVESVIGPNTRAIVLYHFCGYPGFLDEILEIAKDKEILVIEDAFEAFGSYYKERPIGNTGADASVFSFGFVRLPNALGAGAVVLSHEKKYEKILKVRDCGIDRRRFRDEDGEISESYTVKEMGLSACANEIQGYVGYEQMKVLSDVLLSHAKNAKYWDESLNSLDNIRPLSTVNGRPNYWVYGLLTDNKEKSLNYFRKNGYYASGVHADLSKTSYLGEIKCGLSGVKEFAGHFLAIPCGWWIC